MEVMKELIIKGVPLGTITPFLLKEASTGGHVEWNLGVALRRCTIGANYHDHAEQPQWPAICLSSRWRE